MKARIKYLSPGDLGLFLGILGFLCSLPVMLRDIIHGIQHFQMEPLSSLWLFILTPIYGILSGMIPGFLLAWGFNLFARCFGGIGITIEKGNLD